MDRGTSNKRRDIFYTYIEQSFTGFKCRPSDMRRKETVSGCKQWIVCPRRFHIEHIGADAHIVGSLIGDVHDHFRR